MASVGDPGVSHVARPRAAVALGELIRRQLHASAVASQRELATKAGFSESVISALINAERPVPRGTVASVASVLSKDVHWLAQVDSHWLKAKAAWLSGTRLVDDRNGPAVEPTPLIRQLLSAQLRASSSLPYRLLIEDAPPLATLYVEQEPESFLEEIPSYSMASSTSKSSARLQSIREAMAANENIVLAADAGGGKSTAIYHCIAESAAWWLTPSEARATSTPPLGWAIPVRVGAACTARAMLATAIAESIRLELGEYLEQRLEDDIFTTAPMPGMKWLVLVDGLDEIMDSTARFRVIDALAKRVEEGHPSLRILVTSRPLGGTDLAPLRKAGAVQYRLKPFSIEQFAAFSRNWFSARSPRLLEIEADRFVQTISRAGLASIVRLPLLATIAAIVYEGCGESNFPRSRAELYRQFFHYLLDVRQSTLRAREQMSDILSVYSRGREAADWLFEQLPNLLEVLAVRVILGRDVDGVVSGQGVSIVESAARWTSARAPFDVSRIPGWVDVVRLLLVGSGILHWVGEHLEFTHRSFAEYLAGLHMARSTLGGGMTPAAVDATVRHLSNDAIRGTAIFALGHWTRQEGRSPGDVDRLLKRLVRGSVRQTRIAAELVIEGICGLEYQEDSVRSRLQSFAMDRRYASQAVSTLARLPDRRKSTAVLRRLAEQSDLPSRNVDIALELASCGFRAEAVTLLLRDYSKVLPPSVMIRTGTALYELSECDKGLGILVQAAEDGDSAVGLHVSRALVRLGELERAKMCAQRTLLQQSPDDVEAGEGQHLGILLARLGDKNMAGEAVGYQAASLEERARFFVAADYTLSATVAERLLVLDELAVPDWFWRMAADAGQSDRVMVSLEHAADRADYDVYSGDHVGTRLAAALVALGSPDRAVACLLKSICNGYGDQVRESAGFLRDMTGDATSFWLLSEIVRDSSKFRSGRVAAAAALIMLGWVEEGGSLLTKAIGKHLMDLQSSVEWVVDAACDEEQGTMFDLACNRLAAEWDKACWAESGGRRSI